MDNQDRTEPQRSEFVRWARNGVALGIAVMLAVPMLTAAWNRHHVQAPPTPPATQQMGEAPQVVPPGVQLEDFGSEEPAGL